jgi:hypothetical protein
MEKLTIDEIIEHCDRKTGMYEKACDIKYLETTMNNSTKEYWEHKQVAEYLRKFKDYEDLEEQGRLVKLPCNRGDKIYFIKSAFSMAHFPIEARITSICGIDCDSDVMYSSITEYNKIDRRFKSSDIGKTVFLTKSEAEAKLKELRGGE